MWLMPLAIEHTFAAEIYLNLDPRSVHVVHDAICLFSLQLDGPVANGDDCGCFLVIERPLVRLKSGLHLPSSFLP